MSLSDPPGAAGARTTDDSGRVAYLDQALWKRLAGEGDGELDVEAWLALQAGLVGNAVSAVLVLGPPDVGPYKPVAYWPAGRGVTPLLSAAAELAVTRRRGVVQGDESGSDAAGRSFGIAYPVTVDGALRGVVAVETAGGAESQLRAAMRQLQWGAAWVEVLLRRREAQADAGRQERVAAALDLIASALEAPRFAQAALGVVTELATRLGCERVSLGFLRRGRSEIAAISHTAQFSRRMNLVRRLAAAMDEAIDQRVSVACPAPDDSPLVTRAHAQLIREHAAGAVLTVPLHVQDRHFGALTLEFPAGREIDPALVELCELVGAVVGPILHEKRLNDRWLVAKIGDSLYQQGARLFGPRYLGRKLALAVLLLLVVFFSFATDEYRVAAPASLEGEVQRVIAAPIDGYIRSAEARAGDTVRAGQLVAKLDDQELILERHRWQAEHRQKSLEYDQALAEGKRAETQIIRAQIAEAAAQIELLSEQLARTDLRSPFDGIVISGDLSQSIGKAVRRGETLFEIAPLDSYRVAVKVDETDIEEVAAGQTGQLVIASMPDTRFDLVVDRVTPASQPEEGRNHFRVEAHLTAQDPRLRPGMEGIGKIAVGERKLIWIWTHGLVDWLRLQAWRWWP